MANKKYKLANSDYWETSGVYDLTEGKTQRAINAEVKGSLNTVEQDVENLKTVQKINVTVTPPSQFSLDTANPPKVYRSGGLGFLTIIAWTNQEVPAGTTEYIFSVSGVNIIPSQGKTISGQFDINYATSNGRDISLRALQGIGNSYRVILTLPIYYE